MAVSVTYINNDFNALKNVLTSSGLFDSVTIDAETNTVTMKDSDDHTLATIAPGTNSIIFTAYLNNNTSQSVTYSTSSPVVLNAWKCENGVMLDIRPTTASYQDKFAFILISQTNHNIPCFVFSSVTNNGGTSKTQFYAICFGDYGNPIERKYVANDALQTVLCPFASNSSGNVSSYTPNAFFIPFGQYYSAGYGKLTINNVVYMTNGYWAIKDA